MSGLFQTQNVLIEEVMLVFWVRTSLIHPTQWFVSLFRLAWSHGWSSCSYFRVRQVFQSVIIKRCRCFDDVTMSSFWRLRILYRLRNALLPTILALKPSLYRKISTITTRNKQIITNFTLQINFCFVLNLFKQSFRWSSNGSLSSRTALPNFFHE
jgi:hypothetical protein